MTDVVVMTSFGAYDDGEPRAIFKTLDDLYIYFNKRSDNWYIYEEIMRDDKVIAGKVNNGGNFYWFYYIQGYGFDDL